ncbi:protein of unknown function [Natronincola peptidivorans]|uniref:DUF3784 domain-containing protein n=1 Tax=Natronincola peptidivorans TaxID=426128 RepID=A0A1I0BRI9_9FIRM|nr:DUF3784 domain-containing protein [Natronincola peptidivorans]SET08955.1 protein of unknown function [Natronincola peptidivorans]
MEIFLAVFIAVAAIGLFIYSVFLFQEKGPIPTTFYMLAKPEERKRMKTKAEYRFTGIVMLTLSVIFLLKAIMITFSIAWLSKVIIAISIILVIYILIYAIREIMNL